MILRRDHVAGVAIAAAFGAVWLSSGDLPIGSLSMPGAGMMPNLMILLGVVLALAVALAGGQSPPLGEIGWSDLPHALAVLAVTIPAVALYTTAGFMISVTLLLLCLLVIVERRNVISATVFSVGVAVSAYYLFGTLLKSPLPAGVLSF